jgi:hypothetical protein
VTRNSGSVIEWVSSMAAVNASTPPRTTSQPRTIVFRERRSAITGEGNAADRERGEVAAERGRGVVDREHCERERHRHERVADARGDPPEPEQSEPTLPQRGEGEPRSTGDGL